MFFRSTMGILKITTNLAANAKYKFKRFLSASYSSSVYRRVPASGGTALTDAWWHTPDLNPAGADDISSSSSNSLMLAVKHVRNGTRDYTIISTEGDSFEVMHKNPPNFSILRAANYNNIYQRGDYEFLGSCHKWMLLQCNKFRGFQYELLWNPTTYEVRPLPFFAWPPLMNDGQWLHQTWSCYGMWFDPSSEDYKVVRYGELDDPIEIVKYHAELFSLKAGYWKEIPCSTYDPFIWPFSQPVVNLNGISYWIAIGRAPTPSGSAVVSFDFSNENFQSIIPIPERPIPGSNRLGNHFEFHIVEFHGLLAACVYDSRLAFSFHDILDNPLVESNKSLVENTKPTKRFSFEIWVWNEKDNKWSFHSTYDVPPLDDDDAFVDRILGLYKNDKALLQDSNGSLLLYNCHTKVLKDLGIRDELCSMDVYPYVQST